MGTVGEVFVKVCGVMRAADAAAAVAAGVDAIGLNFTATSRRRVDLETARAVLAEVPDHVLTVGVFRDQAADEVLATVATLGLRAAQLHGDEPPEVCAAVGAEVGTLIRAVVDGADLAADHGADIVLVDGPDPGSGRPGDWDRARVLAERHRVLLAGGLGPDNVGEAVRRVRPWGVDVASGVEAEPGRKDPDAMARLVATARAGPDGDERAPGS